MPPRRAGGVREPAPLFETIGQRSQRERLDLGDRLCLSASVREHARKIRYLRDKPAVGLSVDLDLQQRITSGRQAPHMPAAIASGAEKRSAFRRPIVAVRQATKAQRIPPGP